MPKQKKPRITTNILDTVQLKNRSLCFDGGFLDKERAKFLAAKAKAWHEEDLIKRITKAHLIQYMDTYNKNYELLHMKKQPKLKFRPPRSVLPVFMEPKKINTKSRSLFLKPISEPCPHCSRSPTVSSSVTLLSSRRKLDVSPTEHISTCLNRSLANKGRTFNVTLQPVYSRDSFRAKQNSKIHGHSTGPISKPASKRSNEESSDMFYDLESTSRTQ